jgi:hypothetical protein
MPSSSGGLDLVRDETVDSKEFHPKFARAVTRAEFALVCRDLSSADGGARAQPRCELALIDIQRQAQANNAAGVLLAMPNRGSDGCCCVLSSNPTRVVHAAPSPPHRYQANCYTFELNR